MILPPPTSTLFPYTTLFRSVLRHLQAVRRRFLQDRPAALQPRRGVVDERAERQDVSCRACEPRGAARVVARELKRGALFPQHQGVTPCTVRRSASPP